MKQDIHPKYYTDAKVICACGNTFETGSTQKELRVEVCSACHPFYTGKDKMIDTEGRVEKFEKKAQVAAARRGEYAARLKVKKQKEEALKPQKAPQTLKDMLKDVQKTQPKA